MLEDKTKDSFLLNLPRMEKKIRRRVKNAFFFFFFDVGHFFKVFIDLLQYCFCFMFSFFWPLGMWTLAPRPGIEPASPALKGKVFTTRNGQESPRLHFKMEMWM